MKYRERFSEYARKAEGSRAQCRLHENELLPVAEKLMYNQALDWVLIAQY
jgi:hypothetical protein